MKSPHPLCFRWFVLFLVMVPCMDASNSNTNPGLILEFEKPSLEQALFQELVNYKRIVTDVDRLTFQASSPEQRFLLMRFNGDEFPVFSETGRFSKSLDLRPGINELQLMEPGNGLAGLDREIVYVVPAKVESLVGKAGDSEHALPLSSVDGSEPLVTSNPSVLISGKRGQPQDVGIQARDQYGNLLMVQTDEDRFWLNYTLEEGSNLITVRSDYDGQSLTSETFKIELVDPIVLSDLASSSAQALVQRGTLESSYISELSSIPVSGSVPSIENGQIELTVNEVSQLVPVEDHEFESTVELDQARPTLIKVGFSEESRSFFDHMEVRYQAPRIQKQQLIRGTVQRNGSIHYSDPVRSDNEGRFLAKSPFLQVSGTASFSSKELVAMILNHTTGEVLYPDLTDWNFESQIRLAEGENQIELCVATGDHRQILVSEEFVVEYQDATEVRLEACEPLQDGSFKLSSPTLALSGFVPALKYGQVELVLNDQSYAIPIENGMIRGSIPVVSEPGTHVLEASIQAPGFEFEKQFSLKIDESVVVEFSGSDSDQDTAPVEVAKADITGQRTFEPNKSKLSRENPSNVDTQIDDSAVENLAGTTQPVAKKETVFTPPKPIDTPMPEDVKDPNRRRRSISGSCLYQFVIGKDGRISRDSISVLKTSNELLNEAGIEALLKWRFKPALEDGEPVEKRTRIQLNWR